jgi:soluble lytic murein transglycosylase
MDNNVELSSCLALIEVESSYRHDAISPDGSRGLMQLKPRGSGDRQGNDMSYNGSFGSL